jgi:tetratricopeptide repeat protein
VLGGSLLGFLLSADMIDPAHTEQLFAEAIACTERSGDQLITYLLRNNAGVHALRAGDLPAARAHLEQAARAAWEIGEESSSVTVNLGWVLRQEGDPDSARH